MTFQIDPQVSSVEGIKPETILAMIVIHEIWRGLFGDLKVLRFTSIVRKGDPKLHGTGFAVDCGCRDISNRVDHNKFISLVRSQLSRIGYDVIHETMTTHKTPEHLHVEFDPR